MDALLGCKYNYLFRAYIFRLAGARSSPKAMTTKRIIGIYEIPGAKDSSDSINDYIKIIVECSEESICTYYSSEESIPSREDNTDHSPSGVQRPPEITITKAAGEDSAGEVKHPLVRRHTFPQNGKEQQNRSVHDGEEPGTERS